MNASIKNFSHYFNLDILNDISAEADILIRLKDLKEQIDTDELGEKYFKKYWEGSSSNLDNINSHYEKLTQFTALVKSKFFTSKTEEILCDFDLASFNDKIANLNVLKESILDDFASLNSINVFKNNKLTNLPIKSLYDKIELINKNLSQIKQWEEYKKEKIKLTNKKSVVIYDLFEYDLENITNSFSNLLNDCNLDNGLENEVNTILKLKEIKKDIDSNE